MGEYSGEGWAVSAAVSSKGLDRPDLVDWPDLPVWAMTRTT